MGDYFRSPNLCFKKPGNVRKHPFVLLQLANEKFLKKRASVFIKRICVETGMLVVTLNERVISLNPEEDVFLGRIVEV